jgi:rhamnulokinase
MFPEIVPPGTQLGHFQDIPIIVPASHDTGSVVAAMPAQTNNFAYISSGTWSLVGLEVTQPILNEATLTANTTGIPVVAGPIEVTVIGNALVQLISLGEIADIAQARQIAAGIAESNLP